MFPGNITQFCWKMALWWYPIFSFTSTSPDCDEFISFRKVSSSRSENQSQPCSLLSRLLPSQQETGRKKKKEGKAQILMFLRQTKPYRERERDGDRPRLRRSGWWFIPDSETSELGSRYSGEPNTASIKSLLLCQLFKHIPGEMLPFKGSRMGFYKNLATLSNILS